MRPRGGAGWLVGALLAASCALSCRAPLDVGSRRGRAEIGEPRATLSSAAPTPTAASSTAPSPLEMAVTVDDLPIHGPAFVGIDRLAIADRMLRAFRAHHLPPVYGFVNGKKVDDEPETEEVLRHWLAAGNPLGNHTHSHISLNEASLPDYLADLERGERILRELEPRESDWRFFRYPYLFEGPDLERRRGVRDYLSAHHYTIAEVTIDGDDWAWNAPFARCTEKHDAAALRTLRDGYVVTHVNELRFIRKVTRELEGRDIRHVLLLHIGAADADAIDDLLTAFEHEGVRFVDLSTALADPFYAHDPGLPSKAGASMPYPVAKARGIDLRPLPARPHEDALESTCR